MCLAYWCSPFSRLLALMWFARRVLRVRGQVETGAAVDPVVATKPLERVVAVGTADVIVVVGADQRVVVVVACNERRHRNGAVGKLQRLHVRHAGRIDVRSESERLSCRIERNGVAGTVPGQDRGIVALTAVKRVGVEAPAAIGRGPVSVSSPNPPVRRSLPPPRRFGWRVEAIMEPRTAANWRSEAGLHVSMGKIEFLGAML